MSRTRSRGKRPGYEFWSNRPGNKAGGVACKDQKVTTHRLERRRDVRIVEAELDELAEVSTHRPPPADPR